MTRKNTETGSRLTLQESKNAGRPQTWQPKWDEGSQQYQIRKTLPSGKRERFYLGDDLEEAKRLIECKVKPLVIGTPTLDNGNTTWREALPLLWELENARRDSWVAFPDTESRVRRCSEPVMDVTLKELKGLRQKFWQKILDHGREVVKLGYPTQKKVQDHLRMLMPTLVREGWCDGTEQNHLTIGHFSTKKVPLHAAQPSIEMTARYLLSSDVPLEYRIEEWINLDFASNRGMDIVRMTWGMLGAPDFDGTELGNTKTRGTNNNRRVSWYLGQKPHPLRAKVIQYWLAEGGPTGDTLVFPVRRGKRKGEAKLKRNGSQLRRKYYARSMGITLGALDNSGHGGMLSRQHSDPPPSAWKPEERDLLLGSERFRPMDYHSTRASFDTRLNRLKLDEKTAQVLTQHSHKVSREAYDQAHLQEQEMHPDAMLFPDGPKASGQNSGQNSGDLGK